MQNNRIYFGSITFVLYSAANRDYGRGAAQIHFGAESAWIAGDLDSNSIALGLSIVVKFAAAR